MTPVASTAAARGAATTLPPLRPRRVSGPAAPPRRGRSDAPVRTRRPQPRTRTRTQPAPAAELLARLARRAAALPDARLLDRLIRGRAWIALVGAMLIGLVFLQVSLLRLNTGIGRDVQEAQALERANQDLRNQVSTLGSDDRIHQVAAKLGMVMPAAGAVHYLDAHRASAALAARSVVSPDPVVQQAAAGGTAAATGLGQSGTAASTQSAATTPTTAATPTTTATPSATTAQTATTAQATTTAQTTATPQSTAAPPATGTASTGAASTTGGATPAP